MAPAIPVPSAVPITCARRSRGAIPTSHVSPAAHAAAPATPCTNRADASAAKLVPNANATLAAASSRRPPTRVRRAPARDASQPAGSDASSVPSA